MFHFDPAPEKSHGRRKLTHRGHRTLFDGLLRKLAAIGSRARKCEKQKSRLDAPRVVLQSRHWQLPPDRRGKLLPEPYALQDLFDCHGPR